MDVVNCAWFSIITIFAGLGIGRVMHRLWRKDESFVERTVLDLTLGLGFYSMVLFMCGLLGLFAHNYFIMVTVVPAGILGFGWAFTDIIFSIPKIFKHKPSATTVGCVLLLVVLFAAILIPALAPPSMSDWDTLAYHFAIPKLFLQHGGIYRIDSISHSNFPFLVEMLYVPWLYLNIPVAAKMINYWVGVLLVLAIVAMTRKHFNAKAAPMAAIAFAGMPIVMWLATTAYVDLATALYTVVCVHLLLNYLDKHERKSLVGCAIAAGFAASTKMTGLGLIPLLLAWLLIDQWAIEKKFEWKRGLMFVGIALLVCSPWYIKSIVYTGNPVYPFFYSIFGGRNWNAELASHYATQQSLFGMGHNAAAFLILPFNITLHSETFYDRPGLFVGPIFLVALPLLFAARHRSRKLVGLTGFFFALIVTWFLLTQQSRYLVPAFAILAVLVAAIAYQDERFKVARVALMVVFVSTAIFGVLTLWPSIQSAAPVVFGSETRDEYLNRTLDVYPAQKFMNEKLPYNARVLFYGDTRGFYLDRSYAWGDYGHNIEFSRKFASVDGLVSYLKSRGVTHVMVNFHFYPKRGKGTELVYQAIDQGRFAQILPDDGPGDVAVYEVR